MSGVLGRKGKPDTGSEAVSVEDVVVVRGTERALLVLIDGDEKWIPKSVIHDDSEVFEENHNGTLVLKRWFAEKEKIGV